VVDEVRSVVDGKTDCPGDDAGDDNSQSQPSLPPAPLGMVRLVLVWGVDDDVAVVVVVVCCIEWMGVCSSAEDQGARGARGLGPGFMWE
jgi:hypothetical protein